MKTIIFSLLLGLITVQASSVIDRRLDAINSNSAVVHSIPAELDISRGKYPGYEISHVFGRNDDVDTTSVPEDIWNGGGVYTGFPTGDAETIECFSSSDADTAAGTGARTIQLFPLDSNFDAPSAAVVLTMGGSAAVTTSGTFKRLNTVTVLTAGTDATNSGAITCRHSTTTANIFAILPAGTSQTEIAAFTIPNNKKGYLQHAFVDLRDTKTNLVRGALWVREEGKAVRNSRFFSASQDRPFQYTPYGGLPFPEKTDITLRILDVDNNNSDISANLDILLVDQE